MKKIILNEAKLSLLISEAMNDNFSYEELKQIPTFIGRKRYCDNFLGNYIGKGSSRIVYQIDDTKVLKLAYNAKGIAQNEEEYYMSQDSFLDVNTQVFNEFCDDENFLFIVSEYVLPAKKEDFIHCLNIPFEKFVSFLYTIASYYDRHYRRWDALSDEEVGELIENNYQLRSYYDYICNYQPILGDIVRIANYGLVHRDGEDLIVILDIGLNEEILNKYYIKR